MNTSLTIEGAIGIATHWITNSDLAFSSAFISGSATQANLNHRYDTSSDIDCYLVVDGAPPEGKIGKITEHGVLLDVSWIPWSELETSETDAVLASLLHFGQIAQDITGALTKLKHSIDASFNQPGAIAVRLEDMRARIRPLATSANQLQLAPPEQLMNWLFPATLTTHIPLIRACAPLTVRKRFLAAKKVMVPADYEALLALYGFDTVSLDQAQSWLDDTAVLFDHTAPLAESSSRFWASDIMAAARPVSIGGSQSLIDGGLHREALYWIIATRTRCLTVMHDAGVDTSPYMPEFDEMTDSLGIRTPQQRRRRTAMILDWIKT